jgi:membrane-associated phospholipid phosphatase
MQGGSLNVLNGLNGHNSPNGLNGLSGLAGPGGGGLLPMGTSPTEKRQAGVGAGAADKLHGVMWPMQLPPDYWVEPIAGVGSGLGSQPGPHGAPAAPVLPPVMPPYTGWLKFQAWTLDFLAVAAIAEFASSAPAWDPAPLVNQLAADLAQADTKAELTALDELIQYRDGVMAEALTQRLGVVSYFAALCGITPASHPKTLALCGITPASHPKTLALCGIAMHLGQFAVMHCKHAFQRPRPYQLSPALLPPIDVPGHAAFPSGHAAEARLVAACLRHVMPDGHPARAQLPGAAGGVDYLALPAHRISINREVLGMHYRSDTLAGWHVADTLFARMTAFPATNGTIIGPMFRDARDDEWAAPQPAAGGAPAQRVRLPAPPRARKL